MNNENVVKVERLVKAFSNEDVIRNCNMTVKRGTIYGFLGRNGAGKTTVFKLLTGLLKPTNGLIEVLGYKVESESHLLLDQVGLLIESPTFYEHLSAIENLRIHLEYMDKCDINIHDILKLVDLDQTGNKPVSSFSLGMRQRLAIARTIIHKPQLLILDEPLNGLDPIGIREMRDLFKELVKNHGMTILVSSHNLFEIEQIADTIGVIANGNVVEEVPLTKIKEKYPNKLEDYFFNLMKGGKVYA